VLLHTVYRYDGARVKRVTHDAGVSDSLVLLLKFASKSLTSCAGSGRDVVTSALGRSLCGICTACRRPDLLQVPGRTPCYITSTPGTRSQLPRLEATCLRHAYDGSVVLYTSGCCACRHCVASGSKDVQSQCFRITVLSGSPGQLQCLAWRPSHPAYDVSADHQHHPACGVHDCWAACNQSWACGLSQGI
jgi:hypothetical protein